MIMVSQGQLNNKLFRSSETEKLIRKLPVISRSLHQHRQDRYIPYCGFQCHNKNHYSHSKSDSGFLADKNGRILFKPRKNAFSWSNYLREQWFCERPCGKHRHLEPNIKNIPHYYKQPEPMCDEIRECHCEPLEDEGPDIDPNLPLIQQKIQIGLHRLRKYRPPVIWIMGLPHEPMLKSRELFCKDLAMSLDFQYINIDNEIKDIFDTLPKMNKDNIDEQRKQQTTTQLTTSLGLEHTTGRMSYRLVKNGNQRDVRLNLPGILEMLKLTMIQHECAKGFVIDSFPCNEIEAIAFEAMFYPVTFAVYIISKSCDEAEYECDSNEDEDPDLDVVRPTYFRRTLDYTEKDVIRLSLKYKDRCLILPSGRVLGCEEIELTHALIWTKLAQQAEIKPGSRLAKGLEDPDGYPPLPLCKNKYCDCTDDPNPKLKKQLKILKEIQVIIREQQEALWLKKDSCGNTNDMNGMSTSDLCTKFVPPPPRQPRVDEYDGTPAYYYDIYGGIDGGEGSNGNLTLTPSPPSSNTPLPVDSSDNKYKDEYGFLENPAVNDNLQYDFGNGRYVPSSNGSTSAISLSESENEEKE